MGVANTGATRMDSILYGKPKTLNLKFRVSHTISGCGAEALSPHNWS